MRDATSIQPSQPTVVTFLKVPTHCSHVYINSVIHIYTYINELIYPEFHASCKANIRQLTKVTVTFQDIQIWKNQQCLQHDMIGWREQWQLIRMHIYTYTLYIYIFYFLVLLYSSKHFLLLRTVTLEIVFISWSMMTHYLIRSNYDGDDNDHDYYLYYIINNIHEKISRLWLAKRNAVFR